MGSSNNPLNTTKDYYPAVNNASRGNASGSMFKSTPVVGNPKEQPKSKETFAGYHNIP